MCNNTVHCPNCYTPVLDTPLDWGREGVFHVCPNCPATFEECDAFVGKSLWDETIEAEEEPDEESDSLF